MTTDRTEPRWWAKGSPRCRSCGKPHDGFLICDAEGCQRWIVEYTARLISDRPDIHTRRAEPALESTISLPKQSGIRIGVNRLVAAKQKARRIARRLEAQADANQRRQIHREHVSRWRGEDIVVAKEVYL